MLEAAAFSPVHAKVLPPAIPAVVSEDLLKTIVRLAPLMPQLALLFGVAVDPKARPPRPLQQPRGDKGPHKRAGDINKSADAKPSAGKPGARGPKRDGAPGAKPAKSDSAPASSPAEVTAVVEASVAETPASEIPQVEAVVETVVVETVAVEAVVETVVDTPAADE